MTSVHGQTSLAILNRPRREVRPLTDSVLHRLARGTFMQLDI
ncbi:hypothetical protein SAMN05216516_105135 [Izhakiella capsodis]|uniref:Uncharacterized protein n=1 Tax=Izhakiella capsodis TaxID=1367852 RepID=A0A1I4Y2I6_9GAMM|nr:hypothetical protein [Izhakiella capsodis]SFN31699.1 hypothetical protein SAMN05216516_105135 [Izhakiella capsodis]